MQVCSRTCRLQAGFYRVVQKTTSPDIAHIFIYIFIHHSGWFEMTYDFLFIFHCEYVSFPRWSEIWNIFVNRTLCIKNQRAKTSRLICWFAVVTLQDCSAPNVDRLYYASAEHAATETLFFCLVRRSFCPCHQYFFYLARILNAFQWNLREIITATNRLNDYILGKIGTGTRGRIRENIRIDINRCSRNVKQVPTPSEWLTNFSMSTKTDAIADIIAR